MLSSPFSEDTDLSLVIYLALLTISKGTGNGVNLGMYSTIIDDKV
jgi:hypothetical protein